MSSKTEYNEINVPIENIINKIIRCRTRRNLTIAYKKFIKKHSNIRIISTEVITNTTLLGEKEYYKRITYIKESVLNKIVKESTGLSIKEWKLKKQKAYKFGLKVENGN